MKYKIIALVLFFPFFVIGAPRSYPHSKAVKPLVILDSGHGGQDQGAVIKYPHTEEKKLNLTTAYQTKKYLERLGYRVVMTRYCDHYVPLSARVAKANQSRAVLFISIHYNSCPNALANGVEVFYGESPQGKKLARQVLSRVLINTKAKSRGVKEGKFYVIRQTKMPSILIECGFLTNTEEREKIRDHRYLDQIARGIAEGIDQFMRK
ncbi:MAG: N-acetylmuramoyl-L-alanine amidase [Parachlamydiales bacterium]|nr:N-acetylmuramoyl-L-alanine amidase [Parachlamydiales bacterium]